MMRMRAGHDELSTSSIEDDEDKDEDRDEGMEDSGTWAGQLFWNISAFPFA
jgi:hypothetical protein